MKALSIALRGAAVAAVIGGTLVVTAPSASAQNCSALSPGYAKRVGHDGATEYYEDSSCGVDPNRISRPPAPRPQTPGTSGWGCRQYPDGELCGVGIGAPRTPLSHDTWRRLYGSPPPSGTVRVGAPVGMGGGGSGPVGSVSIGPMSNPDKDEKNKKTSTK